MSLKQSMEDNKQHILDGLPTKELKDAFLANLETVEETSTPSIDEQVKEAQAPDHISDELYDGVKKDIEAGAVSSDLSPEEEKAAIEEALKNPPVGEANNDED